PSRKISSRTAPPPSPVPLRMARVILSPGIFSALAAAMAARRRGLPVGSPPPRRAATATSLASLPKTLPRLASTAPFLRLMVLHLEWPDICLLLLLINQSIKQVPDGEYNCSRRL